MHTDIQEWDGRPIWHIMQCMCMPLKESIHKHSACGSPVVSRAAPPSTKAALPRGAACNAAAQSERKLCAAGLLSTLTSLGPPWTPQLGVCLTCCCWLAMCDWLLGEAAGLGPAGAVTGGTGTGSHEMSCGNTTVTTRLLGQQLLTARRVPAAAAGDAGDVGDACTPPLPSSPLLLLLAGAVGLANAASACCIVSTAVSAAVTVSTWPETVLASLWMFWAKGGSAELCQVACSPTSTSTGLLALCALCRLHRPLPSPGPRCRSDTAGLPASRAYPSHAPVQTASWRHRIERMLDFLLSRAETRNISVVPGLAKHVSKPAAHNCCTATSAHVLTYCILQTCIGLVVYHQSLS
jgi:hypothetical protein